jgi:hypothetical protein
MEIAKPKITVGSNPRVPDLIKYYHQGRMTLQELSDAFNEKVQWAYRGIENDNPDWSAANTWATVHQSVNKQTLSQQDYMFLSQEYELYQERTI